MKRLLVLLGHRRFRILSALLLFLLLIFAAEFAEARLGGGGGYRGSSGRSGGSGGGGGDGFIVYLLIRLAIQYPVIGVPALIIFILAVYYGGKNGHSAHVTHSIRKAYGNQEQGMLTQAKTRLKKRDPSFSGKAFAERVRGGFLKLQDAWGKQDLKPLRHLLSDGVFERFTLQLEMQKASKIRNEMSDIEVRNVNLVAIDSDDCFDTIHIRIDAIAVDYFVNIENGKPVYGGKSPAPFTEYWSFLRRPGAKTLSADGLMEGFCPNCGSLLQLNDTMECPSCKALVNSGDYDWVLTEITQASEWNYNPRGAITGVSDLLQKDPTFNVQHVEDRASVIFYRQIAARFFADSKYLAKLAKDDFLTQSAASYKKTDNGKNTFYADAALGAVELVEAKVGEGEMDKLRVRIKWSGHKEEKEVPSLIIPNFQASTFYNYEYILERQSDVKSSDKNVLCSVHCPGCGAPETNSHEGFCEYCHAALNDGSRDWVLAGTRPFSGYPAAQSQFHSLEQSRSGLVTESVPALSKFDSESIIACTAAVMMADGVIDEQEMEILKRFAKDKGIDGDKLIIILNTVRDGEYEIPHPESPASAREFLRCMVLMCLADGKVTSEERKLMKNLTTKMGYTELDINQMITKERSRLYKEARQVNKAA